MVKRNGSCGGEKEIVCSFFAYVEATQQCDCHNQPDTNF